MRADPHPHGRPPARKRANYAFTRVPSGPKHRTLHYLMGPHEKWASMRCQRLGRGSGRSQGGVNS